MSRPTTERTSAPSFPDRHTMSNDTLPLRVEPTPDPVDRELEPLLAEPFASAWVTSDAGIATDPGPLRSRLLDRLAASRAAGRAMFTARLKQLPAVELAPGVLARTLYQARDEGALRPGEPVRAQLLELQAGCLLYTSPSPRD